MGTLPKDMHLKDILKKNQGLLKKFKSYELHHVMRQHNQFVDSLANICSSLALGVIKINDYALFCSIS